MVTSLIANDPRHNQSVRYELFCSDSRRTKAYANNNRYAIATRSVSIRLAEPEPVRVSVAALRNISGEGKILCKYLQSYKAIRSRACCKAQPPVPSQQSLSAFTGVAGRSAAPLIKWQKSAQSWRS